MSWALGSSLRNALHGPGDMICEVFPSRVNETFIIFTFREEGSLKVSRIGCINTGHLNNLF